MPDRDDRSLYTIHHELMNHIATLSTYTHLLSEEELDADTRDMINEMTATAARAHEIGRELAERLGLISPVVERDRKLG